MLTGGKYGVVFAFAAEGLRVGLVGIQGGQTFLVKKKRRFSAKRFELVFGFPSLECGRDGKAGTIWVLFFLP